MINTPIASAVIKIYDGVDATGTLLATITFPTPLVSDGPITVPYNIPFTIGLTIVTTGTSDITAI